MLSTRTRHAAHPAQARAMDGAELRAHLLAHDLFREGEIRLIYTRYGRFVMGGAVPAGGRLSLGKVAETGTETFLERREMGVLNIGGTGMVRRDGKACEMGRDNVDYTDMDFIQPRDAV